MRSPSGSQRHRTRQHAGPNDTKATTNRTPATLVHTDGDIAARNKTLENPRRSARNAGEHTIAVLLASLIDDLRKQRANARPLGERLASAGAKLALTQKGNAKAE